MVKEGRKSVSFILTELLSALMTPRGSTLQAQKCELWTRLIYASASETVQMHNYLEACYESTEVQGVVSEPG